MDTHKIQGNSHLSAIHTLNLCALKCVPDILLTAGKTRPEFGVYSWASVVVFQGSKIQNKWFP